MLVNLVICNKHPKRNGKHDPDQEELIKVKVLMKRCREATLNSTMRGEDIQDLKEELMSDIDRLKETIYEGENMNAIRKETRDWMQPWNEWITLLKAHETYIEQATRYLGVHFNMDRSWTKQRKVLTDKFQDLYDRINRTSPTTEMAVYCINAVINAALKFPLQVAKVPVTLLREWDRKHINIVKKAAKLSKNFSPEIIFLPKGKGGKGLQSIEREADIIRIQSQIRLLNSDSSAGAVVRAAAKKSRFSKETNTIQTHTQKAATKWNMMITTVERAGARGTTIEEQTEIDIGDATSAKRVGRKVHCFGDGATWTDKTGWGIYARDEEGNTLCEAAARTHGKQQNDASEAYAILQGLIRTNPRDPIKLYCDNQGCVQLWNNQREHRRNFEAIWARIDSMRKHRELMGAETEMAWVQSHIQDETKRTSNKSTLTCACRAKTGNIDECTMEGDEYHWIHEGGDKADEAAKSTEDMGLIQTIGEIARGESEYILFKQDGASIELAQARLGSLSHYGLNCQI